MGARRPGRAAVAAREQHQGRERQRAGAAGERRTERMATEDSRGPRDAARARISARPRRSGRNARLRYAAMLPASRSTWPCARVLEIAAVLGLAAGRRGIGGRADGSSCSRSPCRSARRALWATFRVPGDPGPSPWPIPGAARLALELVLLGLGALGWLLAGWLIVGLLTGALIVGHYLMTAPRVRWLLEQH